MIHHNKRQKYQIGQTVKFIDGGIGIIEYSYSQAYYGFNKNNWNEYSILIAEKDGDMCSCAWIPSSRIKCVVDEDTEKGIEIMRKYNAGITNEMDIPMFMDYELKKLLGYA